MTARDRLAEISASPALPPARPWLYALPPVVAVPSAEETATGTVMIQRPIYSATRDDVLRNLSTTKGADVVDIRSIEMSYRQSTRLPLTTELRDEYTSAMDLHLGTASELYAVLMVHEYSRGGVVNLPGLTSKLASMIATTDPVEAASVAFGAAKINWHDDWPSPVSVHSKVAADSEGDSVLRIVVVVRPRDEEHRAASRNDIEAAMVEALSGLGVGPGLATPIAFDFTIASEQ